MHNKNHHQDQKSEETVCPIMGAPIDKKEAEEKGLVRDYKGKKYYFCCPGCPEQFDENPEKYIENHSSSSKEANESNEQYHEHGCC